MSIVITAWDYLYEKNFNEQAFEHRDSRLMDKQTKVAISVARNLHKKVRGEKLESKNIGIILLNNIGPIESITEYLSILKEKGYVGVNPGKFPNIMAVIPLARIAIEMQTNGPCVPILSTKAYRHALIYAYGQIVAGRCHGMMLIHITKKNDCFGCFFEMEYACQKRELKPRMFYDGLI